MSYTVFARKYRPQTFDDVVGQDHITQTLRNAIEQNRLAHAYIFVGPRGTGKTSTARILAKALNCEKGPTIQPCGKCPACVEIAAGNSLDVLEFDAASNTQVDKIREIIIDNVKFAPARGRFKMYIVDEVHMLSNSSFNALLKTLEEPPQHVKFVFATTDVQKVPTTILSRCQRFDLKRIPTALIAKHLLMIAGKESVALSSAAAASIAHGAEGGMRDAESMLDQLVAFCGNAIGEDDVLKVFGFTAQQTVTTLCAHLIEGDAPAALRLVHEQAEAGKDLSRLLADSIAHLRNLLVAQADPNGLADEITEAGIAAISEQAGRIPRDRLLDLIEQFAAAEGRMKWAPNKKLHLEVAVIRAIQTLQQATLSEVLETLAALRGGTPLPSPAPTKRAAAPAAAAPVAKPPPRIEETPVIREPPPSPAPSGDPASIWAAAVATIRNEKHPLRLWVSVGALVAIENGRAILAFPSSQALAVKACEEPANRKYLEELFSRLAGQALRLQCELRENFEVAPIQIPSPADSAPAKPTDPMAEFKNDPFIQKALEIFKAEIVEN